MTPRPAGDAPKRPPDAEDLPSRRVPRPQRVAVSRRGMVSCAHYAATEAGAQILAAGGNAIDAAVAVAFALGVCEPAASGLGGQTMMVLHLAGPGRTIALDGSSRAPNRALPGLLGSAERLRGHRATTVPSTPATLGYALSRYGRLPLEEVLGPALSLAEKGVLVSELHHALAQRERKHLRAGSAGAIFLKNGATPYATGARFKQPALAATLRRLAAAGIEDFYTGGIAAAIAADMERNDGLIRLDDLAQIPWPIERRPLSTRFEATRVITFPPPAAGRTLVEMLNVLANIPPEARDPDTPEGAVLLARLIRRAFLDRRDRPFDAQFYTQVKEKRMLSPRYGREVAEELLAAAAPRDRRSSTRASRHRPTHPRGGVDGSEHSTPADEARGETTHLSVMDAEGNVVALTQSIERVYGSFEASPELGFLYNDYMSAFEYDDMSHPYYLRPNAVPWASVAPTIAFRGRKPWLAIGSPGSDRITPSIVQVLLRLPNHTPFEAVDAPRLHCSLDGVVSLEASRMRDDIPEALRAAGFHIRERDPYAFYHGCVQLVVRDGAELMGVADPRRDGAAGGPERAPSERARVETTPRSEKTAGPPPVASDDAGQRS